MDSEDYLMDTLRWFGVPSFNYDIDSTCCTHWIDQDWDGSVDSLFPGLLNDVCCKSCSPYYSKEGCCSPYCGEEGKDKTIFGTVRVVDVHMSTHLGATLTSVCI